MSMFNDIMWKTQKNEQECVVNVTLCLYLKTDSQQDVGHSSDLDQKQSGISLTKKDKEENGPESPN